MGTHKLILDDAIDEDFSLMAIHCSEEDFKVAYLLNAFGNLQLKRCNEDVFYNTNGVKACFPLFYFEDDFQYMNYYLVANKSKSQRTSVEKNDTLFGKLHQEEILITHLIPEYKKVDYFLKIQSDSQGVPIKKMIALINEIKQVISAYEIDISTLKSKDNLIFD